jgi:hypothetical protein
LPNQFDFSFLFLDLLLGMCFPFFCLFKKEIAFFWFVFLLNVIVFWFTFLLIWYYFFHFLEPKFLCIYNFIFFFFGCGCWGAAAVVFARALVFAAAAVFAMVVSAVVVFVVWVFGLGFRI